MLTAEPVSTNSLYGFPSTKIFTKGQDLVTFLTTILGLFSDSEEFEAELSAVRTALPSFQNHSLISL